jgi:hypothetical protein
MKPIFKLMFVGLLIGAALTLPTRVRASGNEYNCSSQLYGQCMGNLNQWMGQCAYGCTYETSGNQSQYCQYTPYTDCEPDQNGLSHCVSAEDWECWNTTSTGQTCVQGCVNEYTQQMNACLSDYCTQE